MTKIVIHCDNDKELDMWVDTLRREYQCDSVMVFSGFAELELAPSRAGEPTAFFDDDDENDCGCPKAGDSDPEWLEGFPAGFPPDYPIKIDLLANEPANSSVTKSKPDIIGCTSSQVNPIWYRRLVKSYGASAFGKSTCPCPECGNDTVQGVSIDALEKTFDVCCGCNRVWEHHFIFEQDGAA